MDRLSRRTFLKGVGAGAAVLVCPELVRSKLTHARSAMPAPADMERILSRALSRGGDYADLYLELRFNTHIVMTGGEVSALEYGVLLGGGVRTLIGEKSGYAYAESFDVEELDRAAQSAALIANQGSGRLAVPVRPMSVEQTITAEEAIADVDVAAKAALLGRVTDAAMAHSPLIKQVRVDYRDASQEFTIAHTLGEFCRDELPVIYLRVNVTAEKSGVRSEGMVRVSGRRGMELLTGDTPEQAGRDAAEQALKMLDAQPAPTGELPLVIAAGGGVMFHEAVGHGLEADSVLRDATVFAGRVGEQVAAEGVTLYDDGTIPGARGSFNVDDEGTLAQKTLLIEKGVLRGYLQDRRTAMNMKVPVTGNGRRQSFRYPAVPRMSNTNMAPGQESPEEIIKATKSGVYAASFGGGEVDPGSGQFTFGLREAYLIEDGRITAPIRGANLVGSGPEVLNRIDRVGADFGAWPGTCGKADQWVPVTSGCPTLRISKITVGGTA